MGSAPPYCRCSFIGLRMDGLSSAREIGRPDGRCVNWGGSNSKPPLGSLGGWQPLVRLFRANTLVRLIPWTMPKAGSRSTPWGCTEAVAANFQDHQLVPVPGQIGVSNALENCRVSGKWTTNQRWFGAKVRYSGVSIPNVLHRGRPVTSREFPDVGGW